MRKSRSIISQLPFYYCESKSLEDVTAQVRMTAFNIEVFLDLVFGNHSKTHLTFATVLLIEDLGSPFI